MAEFHDMNCSLARALNDIGERWSLLIIREAFMGSRRFEEFHQRLGVARNILSTRLTSLVDADVLRKTVSSENARIFDYELTEKGLDLFSVVAALMHWGDRWLDQGEGPPVILMDRKTGKPVQRVALRRGKTEMLKFDDIEIVPGRGATSRTRKRLSLESNH